MNIALISVGNGGYNVASGLIKANGLDGNALIELRGPISYGITPEARKEVFDSFK